MGRWGQHSFLAGLALAAWLLSNIATAQTETLLYTFTGGSDGGVPYANLVMDNEGNLYGTTQQYGDGACTFPYTGCGTLFMLAPSNGQWTYTVLYTFHGGNDGANPSSSLTIDASGNLYGTTLFGGIGCSGTGCGTVFELRRSGSEWREFVLHRFTGGADGGEPQSGVALDSLGNVYGTTGVGGNTNCFYNGPGCGVVFELKRSDSNTEGWTETVLHTFNGNDGADPLVGVTLDGAGNIYGVTALGGQGQGGTSGGVVFELWRTGTAWTESILYEFPDLNGNPAGPLILDKQGNLYGITQSGGNYGVGSVFELKRPQPMRTVWTETNLYSFPGPPDGWSPLFSGLVFDRKENLYGATQFGGSGSCQAGCGTVFELTKGSDDVWEESDIFSFEGGVDGYYPFSGVIVGNSGELYGMTPQGGDPNCAAYGLSGCGIVFSLKP